MLKLNFKNNSIKFVRILWSQLVIFILILIILFLAKINVNIYNVII